MEDTIVGLAHSAFYLIGFICGVRGWWALMKVFT